MQHRESAGACGSAIMGFRRPMDHGALQSPDHVSGVICHRLCVHHPPHLDSSRAD